MLWMDLGPERSSNSLGDPADYQDPDSSPAGDRLAFDLTELRTGRSDIWISRLSRGVNSRFTFGQDSAYCPAWFLSAIPSSTAPTWTVVQHPPEGDERQRRREAPRQNGRALIPPGFSPDGHFLAYQREDPKTGWDILLVPLTGDAKPITFRATPFREVQPRFSPTAASSHTWRMSRDATRSTSRTTPDRDGLADPHGRRNRPAVEAGRKRALLPGARPEADGGRSPGRRRGRAGPAAGLVQLESRPAPRVPSTFRTGRDRSSSSSRRRAATR